MVVRLHNLSLLHIVSDDVVQRIEQVLKSSSTSANRPEIKIIEMSFLQNAPITLDQLKGLKQFGISTYRRLRTTLSRQLLARLYQDRLIASSSALGFSRESNLIVRSFFRSSQKILIAWSSQKVSRRSRQKSRSNGYADSGKHRCSYYQRAFRCPTAASTSVKDLQSRCVSQL